MRLVRIGCRIVCGVYFGCLLTACAAAPSSPPPDQATAPPDAPRPEASGEDRLGSDFLELSPSLPPLIEVPFEHPFDLSAPAFQRAAELYGNGELEAAEQVVGARVEALRAEGRLETEEGLTAQVVRASLLYRLQRFEEAEAAYSSALPLAEQLWGPEAPDTFLVAIDRASTVFLQGDLERAGELFLDLLDRQAETLGMAHRLTLVSTLNLAHVWSAHGDLEETRFLLGKAIQHAMASLGPTEPITVLLKLALLKNLLAMEQIDLVILGFEDVLPAVDEVYGADSLYAMASRRLLILTYCLIGATDEAAGQLEKLEDAFGPGAPETLPSRVTLGAELFKQGQPAQGLALLRNLTYLVSSSPEELDEHELEARESLLQAADRHPALRDELELPPG